MRRTCSWQSALLSKLKWFVLHPPCNESTWIMHPLPCLDSYTFLHFTMPLKIALLCKPILLFLWSNSHISTVEGVGTVLQVRASCPLQGYMWFSLNRRAIMEEKIIMHCDVGNCCNIVMGEDLLNLGSCTVWGCLWREANRLICLFAMALVYELSAIRYVHYLNWQYFFSLYLNILMHDKLRKATYISFLVDLKQLLADFPCRYLSLQSILSV
jgi:hypothetical protein